MTQQQLVHDSSEISICEASVPDTEYIQQLSSKAGLAAAVIAAVAAARALQRQRRLV
jgi:hypothetical protein